MKYPHALSCTFFCSIVYSEEEFSVAASLIASKSIRLVSISTVSSVFRIGASSTTSYSAAASSSASASGFAVSYYSASFSSSQATFSAASSIVEALPEILSSNWSI